MKYRFEVRSREHPAVWLRAETASQAEHNYRTFFDMPDTHAVWVSNVEEIRAPKEADR